MSTSFRIGGILSGIALLVFGGVAIWMGADARDTVQSSLAAEKIVGTEDSSIAGDKVDTGDEAKAFADVMRKHTLEATGGKTYAELPRYLGADGTATNDEKKAATDDKGKPVDNPLRALWVTETALTTALNMSYLAENLALFAIVVGVALMLTGVGFLVIVAGVLQAARSKTAS